MGNVHAYVHGMGNVHAYVHGMGNVHTRSSNSVSCTSLILSAISLCDSFTGEAAVSSVSFSDSTN